MAYPIKTPKVKEMEKYKIKKPFEKEDLRLVTPYKWKHSFEATEEFRKEKGNRALWEAIEKEYPKKSLRKKIKLYQELKL